MADWRCEIADAKASGEQFGEVIGWSLMDENCRYKEKQPR